MSSKADVVTAEQAKRSAKIFHYGNILAVLIPFPLFIFWFGGSMITYAMLRHNPNPRVGHYTQIGAYFYYGLAGLLIPVLTFAPGDFFAKYWLHLWILGAMVMIPLSIYQILKINREQWYDTNISH
ncbi:hypothetical protein [Thiofilum flexile]|uniref:hypothetical protein n=1 Tax=Thiofilum flexile TaxID=125627 RepID=UPI00036C5673|nr:hypothetical protein [Thiofilum flexile]